MCQHQSKGNKMIPRKQNLPMKDLLHQRIRWHTSTYVAQSWLMFLSMCACISQQVIFWSSYKLYHKHVINQESLWYLLGYNMVKLQTIIIFSIIKKLRVKRALVLKIISLTTISLLFFLFIFLFQILSFFFCDHL